ncbi:MAG: hypothetical protein FWC26_00825 [Fibromonadales bacterium]|nr:hypothetical protein [Fibromonadales bacterium]
MNNKVYVASEEDYIKFKKFLQFFVQQSAENRNGPTGPNRLYSGADLTNDNKRRANAEFLRSYNLADDFAEIAGLKFGIMFYFSENAHNDMNSTYINIGLFNIVGQFEIGKVIALRNYIRLGIPPAAPTLKITGEARDLCAARNNDTQFNRITDLGIDDNDAPNALLKSMLDEYLKNYSELFEMAMNSVVRR